MTVLYIIQIPNLIITVPTEAQALTVLNYQQPQCQRSFLNFISLLRLEIHLYWSYTIQNGQYQAIIFCISEVDMTKLAKKLSEKTNLENNQWKSLGANNSTGTRCKIIQLESGAKQFNWNQVQVYGNRSSFSRWIAIIPSYSRVAMMHKMCMKASQIDQIIPNSNIGHHLLLFTHLYKINILSLEHDTNPVFKYLCKTLYWIMTCLKRKINEILIIVWNSRRVIFMICRDHLWMCPTNERQMLHWDVVSHWLGAYTSTQKDPWICIPWGCLLVLSSHIYNGDAMKVISHSAAATINPCDQCLRNFPFKKTFVRFT